MTWSLIARDNATGHFGAAIASRFFAVGALCVYTRRAVGAVATQALVNPGYGPAGLDALAEGRSPDAIVAALGGADRGRAHRQVHLIGSHGQGAAYTGAQCIESCAAHVHQSFSVAGNMLAGPEVLEATARAFTAGAGKPLAERLLDAMDAGQAAGGDKRGQQAAALRIHGDEDYPSLDLRVDDHAAPLAELRRLYGVSLERFQPFVACLAGRRDAAGVLDRGEIEARIAAFASARGARS